MEPKANGPVATVLSRLTLLDSTASLWEVHPCDPSKRSGIRIILSYIVSSRPAWAA